MNRYRLAGLLVIGSACLSVYYAFYKITPINTYPPLFLRPTWHNIPDLPDGITCRYPRLDPFDPEILHSWKPPDRTERLECPVVQRQFTYIDESTMTVRLNLTTYNSEIHECRYRSFDRAPKSDHEIVYGESKTLTESLSFTDSDFFEIWCTEQRFFDFWTRQVYHTLHACPRTNVKDVLPSSEDHLSVAIYMQDSLSHSSFIRELPKTVQFLKDDMGAFIFEGFHKVGENTIPNMFPVLTGLFYDRTSTEELGKYVPGDHNTYYDNLTDALVFTKFKSAGYATSVIEDHAYYSTFHYASGKGFQNPPSRIFTHYYQPYYLLREQNRAGTGKNVYSFDEVGCFANQPTYFLDLKLFENTLLKYAKNRHFTVLSISDLSHDPLHSHIHKADDRLTSSLDGMLPYLNHTVLILMSDHGVRYGPARSTTVGFLEERLPFFSIRFPPWFLKKHPQIRVALELNSQRLSSHFDTHATLLDILRGDFQRAGRSTQTLHGQSLLWPIPLNRTCESAGIEVNICTCNISQSGGAEVDKKTARKTADMVLNYMNGLVSKEADHCAKLEERFLYSAKMIKPDTLLVRLSTSPNENLFDAMFKKDQDNWSISGIFRTSSIADESICVRDKSLREFCYCF